jgi:hypothetical protein
MAKASRSSSGKSVKKSKDNMVTNCLVGVMVILVVTIIICKEVNRKKQPNIQT